MERTIIIDNGTGFIKFGYNDNPEFLPLKIPTIIGRSKFPSIMSGMGKKTIYIGNEVNDKQNRGLLDNSFPITNGLINDYEDIEQIWKLVFSQLSIDDISQNEYPLLITEPCNSQKVLREKMAQVMFETFNVSSLFIGNQALLSFYANSPKSYSNGLVIECGDGHTQIVPIYQGSPIKELSLSVNYLSGNTITSYIHHSLIDHHLDIETICNIKEKFFDSISTTTTTTTTTTSNSFKLPDGKTIEIDNNIIENCFDSMFNPTNVLNKLGVGTGCDIGLHQVIYNSILKCKFVSSSNNHNGNGIVDESDDDITNKQFTENIIVSGGNSMFSNFKKRLTNELSSILPKSTSNLNVVASKDRNYSVFKGASMFSSLSTFNSMCVSRQEYNEL